ncbi:uncharacterized protein [Anabrus simplex]|uniref:uncharacterized protein n=1 Tax=Anabrus simplex TaxID=316456 RepID=UPI0035A351D7
MLPERIMLAIQGSTVLATGASTLIMVSTVLLYMGTERGDVLRSTLPRSEKTGTLSRRLSASDELPTGNAPSWDKPLTARSNEAPESKVARLGQDSDSDWEEFSTETKTDTTSALGSDSQINLSTRQSEKIALISKSIEHQLNLTRRKPAGGVEAMFGASAAAPVPVPKPRSQLTSTPPLSEWDLEDFDD